MYNIKIPQAQSYLIGASILSKSQARHISVVGRCLIMRILVPNRDRVMLCYTE